MPATASRPIPRLSPSFSFFLLARPVHHVDVIAIASLSHAFFFFNLAACSECFYDNTPPPPSMPATVGFKTDSVPFLPHSSYYLLVRRVHHVDVIVNASQVYHMHFFFSYWPPVASVSTTIPSPPHASDGFKTDSAPFLPHSSSYLLVRRVHRVDVIIVDAISLYQMHFLFSIWPPGSGGKYSLFSVSCDRRFGGGGYCCRRDTQTPACTQPACGK